MAEIEKRLIMKDHKTDHSKVCIIIEEVAANVVYQHVSIDVYRQHVQIIIDYMSQRVKEHEPDRLHPNLIYWSADKDED